MTHSMNQASFFLLLGSWKVVKLLLFIIFTVYKWIFILTGRFLLLIYRGLEKLFRLRRFERYEAIRQVIVQKYEDIRADILYRINPCKREKEFSERLDDCEDDDTEDEESDDLEEKEELYFSQIIRLDEDMDLHIVQVEMCPDETALVRVVSDEDFTPIYKRKVRYDKRGGRFIVFGGKNLYLDDAKTQPIVKRKEV